MNFITAIIFSWVLLSSIGYDVPQIQTFNNTSYSYVQVVDESETVYFTHTNPYKKGDVITHINGKKIDFAFGGNYVSMVNSQRVKARGPRNERQAHPCPGHTCMSGGKGRTRACVPLSCRSTSARGDGFPRRRHREPKVPATPGLKAGHGYSTGSSSKIFPPRCPWWTGR